MFVGFLVDVDIVRKNGEEIEFVFDEVESLFWWCKVFEVVEFVYVGLY